MRIGAIFTATNKLSESYQYRLDALNPSEPTREYILHNLTTDSETRVEHEWFNQRKIRETNPPHATLKGVTTWKI